MNLILRLVNFIKTSNWISNFSLLILFCILAAILFARPDRAELPDYLRVLAIAATFAATLMANTKYSDGKFNPTHEKGDKRMAIVIAFLAAFLALASVLV